MREANEQYLKSAAPIDLAPKMVGRRPEEVVNLVRRQRNWRRYNIIYQCELYIITITKSNALDLKSTNKTNGSYLKSTKKTNGSYLKSPIWTDDEKNNHLF